MTKRTIKDSDVHPKPPPGYKGKRGGLAFAALAPFLAPLLAPITAAAGNEIVKGIKYGVKKIRGKGVIRSGSNRKSGGSATTKKKIQAQLVKAILKKM